MHKVSSAALGSTPDPMTIEESFRYIENLESHNFIYEEWEIARDLNFVKKFDRLIENCDPRRSSLRT